MREDVRPAIAPLVVSWGSHEDAGFVERHGWQGTRDPAAFLAVPRAIEVHGTFDLDRTGALADWAEEQLEQFGLRRVPGRASPFMRAVELPPGDADELARRLYEDFRVEVPVYDWEGRRILRVSIGPYTDDADVERLMSALERML